MAAGFIWKPVRSGLKILLLFIFVGIIAGCKSDNNGGGSNDPSDTIKPVVSSTNPAGGATDVAINTAVSVFFSETMDASSLTATTFTLAGPGGSVTGVVSYSGTTAIFDPSGDLALNTAYTATITTGATDAVGNALAANYVWSFTTGATSDATPPMVSFTSPAGDATGVAINSEVSAVFSETMDALSLTATTFTLAGPGGSVTGVVSYSSTTAIFDPSGNLASNTTYTATITTGAKDAAGNAPAADYVWSFTTGAAADTTPPMVSSTSPAGGAIGVAINTSISASFNETMRASTLTTATFTLGSAAGPVTGTVNFSGMTATFTPSLSLTGATLYTATITTGAKDASGNALAADYVWSFTTRATPDTTPPTVVSTSPADGATGTAVNSSISATFSETMNASTLTTATFTLSSGTGSVTGTVNLIGTTATFTPSADLTGDTIYTATITIGVKDAAGNALAVDETWSFTTGATPDITPPTVASTSPVNGETEITVLSTISAVFSETMDASSLTTATFALSSVDGPVAGTVDYSGTTATFTPSALLTGDTTYTATITTGAKDAAGNALSADAVWSFTTAIPQWQGDPPGSSLNFDPGLVAGETQNASDGSRIAAAWMEKDAVSGIFQGYVKQRNLADTEWNLLGGSLNIEPAHNIYEPFLAYHQGNLWVAWNECRDASGVPHDGCAVSNIYARYWDGSQWVDPTGAPTPLNRDPGRNGLVGWLRSDGNDLYLVWEEEGAFQLKQVYVKHWDGSNWTDLGGSLNIDTTHNSEEPILDVVEGRPYVIWTEEASSGNYLVYVKHWDGGSWVQDGGSLNISSSQTATYPSIVNYGEIPYAAWHERVSVGGTPVDRLFVKHLSGGSWIPDPDSGPGGTLNIDSGRSTSNLRMASAGTRLYIVWVEANASGINQVYVKQFESGVWSVVPDAGPGGSLNNDVTHSVHEVAITNVGTSVLVSWDEDNGTGVSQVHWKVYY